jgi:hypothetical protein
MTSPLYFLHIAKTAGTSLRSYIESHYAEEAIAPFYLTHELAAFIEAQGQAAADGFALYRGHMGYSLLSHLETKPQLITLLREPVARTLSHYAHIMRHKDHWIHASLPHADMTLDDFLDYAPTRTLITNFQARNLAQDFALNAPIIQNGTPIEPNLGRLLSSFPSPLNNEALLAQAKERLLSCALIGTSDALPDFISALADYMGWEDAPQTPTKNSAPQAQKETLEKVATHTLKHIKTLTQIDTELYTLAQNHGSTALAKKSKE